MAIYRYQHGDSPLEGYTIQHGLGRGGFGEVYYAVSDAGREVALKAVQNYEEIELRGIKHCMNLKHPQLVSIFDIKYTDQGLPFVVMEYIDGPSLRDILDSHPNGLGAAKAAFFLKEIAKGLTYLHESGVVHRDLKPHNVFYEQGVVKIGDYSLSKAISTSHRSGHTVTVGTVHYMAPEISLGRYDHAVDVYALGVMLYEMLKGHPPFLGDSMGEVLMKHVAGEVDVTGIDEPFAHVITKALAKDPNDRYLSAQEMIDDMMGHAALQESVDSLGPETLTVIAEQAMKAARPATPAPAPTAAYHQAAPHPSRKQGVGLRLMNKILSSQANPATGPPHATTMRRSRSGSAFKIIGYCLLIGFTWLMMAAMLDAQHPGPLLPVAFLWGFLAYRWHRNRKKRFSKASDRAPAQRPVVAAQAEEPHPADAIPGSKPFAAARGPMGKHSGDPWDPTISESPYSRGVALIMCCVGLVVPVAGLQRLYVGRIKSGILWLLTFGLLGIGQIIDTVMVALGQFRDLDGNRVLDFTRDKAFALKQPVNEYSAVVRQRWTESRVGFKLGNLLFNSIGAILLLVALGFGAVMVVDIPQAIASGALGANAQGEFHKMTGFTDWNVIASALFGVITLIAGSLAAICLVLARRESNWTHMLRVLVAAAMFVGSVMLLGTTTRFGRRWTYIAERLEHNLVGDAFQYAFSHEFWPGLIMACLTFVLGIFILAWPARRRHALEQHIADDRSQQATPQIQQPVEGQI